jgi:thioredoxin reductase
MKPGPQYDVIIIGGSYAGLAAGMALGRALRKVLIIDNGKPCNVQTPHSHNFLTNDGKPPNEIARIAKEQVKQYDSVEFLQAFATDTVKNKDGFETGLLTGQKLFAKKIVLATGIQDTMPDIPGFAESWGISVLHCPYCHGYEVRNQKTGILANGDTGFEMLSLISNWTKDLTLYTDGPSTLSDIQAKKLKKYNIPVVETDIHSLDHKNGYIENIVFSNGRKESLKILYARVPFIQHSAIPKFLQCELTDEGYIKIDPAQRTTVPGVYACGDNSSRIRTVANAVAMGTTTGIMVNRDIIEEEF